MTWPISPVISKRRSSIPSPTPSAETPNCQPCRILPNSSLPPLASIWKKLALNFDANKGEVTYHVELTQDVMPTEKLELQIDLPDGSASFDFSTDGTTTGAVTLQFDIGIDIEQAAAGDDPLDWFFIRDASIVSTLDISAPDIDTFARFGFLEIFIEDGSASAQPVMTAQLSDPGSNVDDGRIDMRELLAALDTGSTLVTKTVSGAANFNLPIRSSFLEITPGPDTTLTLSISDLNDAGRRRRYLAGRSGRSGSLRQTVT